MEEIQKLTVGEMQKQRHSGTHKEAVANVALRISKAMRAHKRAMAAEGDSMYSHEEATEALGRAVDAVQAYAKARKGAHGEEGGAEEDHLFEIHKCLKAMAEHYEKLAKCHKALAEHQGNVRDQHEMAAAAVEKAMADFADEPKAKKVAKRNGNDPLYDLIQEQARNMGLDTATILASKELKRELMAKVIGAQLTKPHIFGDIK
jgi:serine phosphatase RsbU (regulator of sigma subunit)